MNIIEAIKERRSVRSYNGESLTDAQKKALNKLVDDVNDPFGGNISIKLSSFDLKEGFKPSTYGMVRGASDFFLLGIGDEVKDALAAGFCFEQVVLGAWQMGLGTCWIAATFKGTDFEKGVSWPDGVQLRIVCPVGVSAEKSLVEKFTRFVIGSKNREPFERIFFQEREGEPLPADSPFREPLEMMRIAPSSKNSQPWRALVCGNKVHFYSDSEAPISTVDCGIGICHFYETEKFLGRNGSLAVLDEHPAPSKWRYIATYTAEE